MKDHCGKFIIHRKYFNFVNYFEKLKKLNIGYLIKSDKDYPENLKELDMAPSVLYYWGKLSKNDRNAVAIVGSRKMTSYEKDVTEKFSQK